MAKRRRPPGVSGILNVYKPEGITSRRVVDRVLELTAPAKVGHAGTLDPMATGVLVVCVGHATRLISFVQEKSKRYRAEFLLGRTSDTDDVTGAVTITEVVRPVTRDDIERALPAFVGVVQQTPPAFSAVHVQGQRAYALAREGRSVTLTPRDVEVTRIDLVAYDWPRLEMLIECGSGTYIRSIGRDLGAALGVGAVMSALERTRIGPFNRESAIDFESLDRETLASALQPSTAAVAEFPSIVIAPADAALLRKGQKISRPENSGEANCRHVVCVDDSQELIAITTPADQGRRLQPAIVVPAPPESS